MKCYHCGGRLQRTTNHNRYGERHRWFRCHDCGGTTHTVERYVNPKPGPAPGTPKTGPAARGERNAGAVFTADNIIEVRRLAASGMMQKDIAAQFGMRPSYVSRIVNRHAWKHIE